MKQVNNICRWDGRRRCELEEKWERLKGEGRRQGKMDNVEEMEEFQGDGKQG